jgi:hypothetical protein
VDFHPRQLRWMFCYLPKGLVLDPLCTGFTLVFKKWKNPSSALHRKRTRVQALPWFLTCSLGLPASGTDLKSRKGLYSGPSPLLTTPYLPIYSPSRSWGVDIRKEPLPPIHLVRTSFLRSRCKFPPIFLGEIFICPRQNIHFFKLLYKIHIVVLW